ncbi:MAG TPA: GNAT family N-acetyltransferase [Pyrinomonadaceae bacterium]|nr:GNAT family N-acetyltransferase [Pyrinomonadaceae bacterium]
MATNAMLTYSSMVNLNDVRVRNDFQPGDLGYGFLLLMHREANAAQLRYFLLAPEYRGIGLGKRLMDLYMEFLHACGYKSSYLWTTNEQEAAASLYRRYGFVLTEEKESTAFGKALKEQRYYLRLS